MAAAFILTQNQKISDQSVVRTTVLMSLWSDEEGRPHPGREVFPARIRDFAEPEANETVKENGRVSVDFFTGFSRLTAFTQSDQGLAHPPQQMEILIWLNANRLSQKTIEHPKDLLNFGMLYGVRCTTNSFLGSKYVLEPQAIQRSLIQAP